MPTRAVRLQGPWEPANLCLVLSPKTRVQVWPAGAVSTWPAQLPPGTERPPLTCPCTMAFSRASTACRASGGRSGCSKSETAFQSASTACCPAKKGQGLVCWPLNLRDSSMGKGQSRTTWSFDLELTLLKPSCTCHSPQRPRA